jgi:O-succinylbenzoate synthase
MLTIDAIHLREINMPLAYPFETSFGLTTTRRIMLVEIESDGLTAWGECVAGEHPYYSDESIDTAWIITESELVPRLLAKEIVGGGSCPNLFQQVRGHRMAKAALENAVWDLEAQKRGVSLAELLGGTRSVIPCGVSIGIQPSPAALMDKIAEELEAGYQRIKLKCKPGWDVKIFEQVRKRWPEILLSCDANSAYRVVDIERIVEWDEFKLLMIEQPLWYDDFYFHSMLQKRLDTAICLDESIRNRRDALAAIDMESCRIINIKVGRVGGFSEAIAVHNAAEERGIVVWCGGMLESGIPGDVSASRRYWTEDIIEPEVTVSSKGEITVPTGIGSGYKVLRDRIDALTVRSQTIRAGARVMA